MPTILVHKPTGKQVSIGDTLPDFRGDMVTVLDFRACPAPSTGRVTLRDADGSARGITTPG